ncbi:MAG TPA: RagB/SusD family nutrient uptake outer membrane protein [Hymenobacter sp.]|jgi:hypothetical protein|uniref:RagB/SusD family nutrient uptake outer membrane protein n=1 Tax=Hymenobacter sp. TaxID=1898978 RepID=UPI002ED8FB0B
MFRNYNLRPAAVAALLLASATGCEVLTQEPPFALEAEDAFSAGSLDKTAIGMYNDLQNAEFLGGRALIYSDVRSDDTNTATFFGNISTFNQQANDGTAANAWTAGYRTLYGANFFLQQIAKSGGRVTPALEEQYKGEAKFIRALVYFHLVNLYAQPYNFTSDASHLGIPLQLTAPDNPTSAFDPAQNLPRSTVKQVYEQMEKDLTDAIASLPETYATSAFQRTARATKDAARGLLSRIYLYQGKYADAAAMANDVIKGGNHALNPSPATVFTTAGFRTSESIFSVAMNTADNPNTNNAIGQHYLTRRDITVTPYARIDTLSFRAKDRRRTQLLSPATTNATNPNLNTYYPTTATALISTLKYSAGVADYVPIVRYSEVLLNRAEGLAQADAGISSEAITLLNTVRTRSLPPIPFYIGGTVTTTVGGAPVTTTYPGIVYTAASFANKQALIDAILFERRLELAFEGHRYYDLMRYKRPSSRIAYGQQKSILPIPVVDIQQNPNLVQNPGY